MKTTIMKASVALSVALLQSAVILASMGTPASAASSKTNAFLAHVIPDVDFLDRSSRMALDHTKNAQIRTFARSEAAEQTMAANQVDDWIEATKGKVIADAGAPPSSQDQVVTGRSVAVDQPAPTVTAPPAVSQEDIDHIDGMADGEFDDFYKAKQAEALTQLFSAYQDYSTGGDDPVLQAVAKDELPRIARRLAALRRL